MDQAVDQSLSQRTCDHCGTLTFEANLTCHSCSQTSDPCSVSGYPVMVRGGGVRGVEEKGPGIESDFNEIRGRAEGHSS